MKIFSLTLLHIILLVIISCTRINQESRDYYQSKKVRHGIIPLSGSAVKKLEAASVERGKAIYKSQCMSCHGVNADGNGAFAEKGTKPANLQKIAQEVRDFKFFMSISQWQGDMPGWTEPINEKEREDLTSYIKSLRTE